MASPDLIVPLLINGKEDPGSGTFDVVSSKTGNVCWKAGSSSPADAVRAVEAAQKAFPSWSKTKPAEKQRILFKAADLLTNRIPEYGAIMETEMGGDTGPVQHWVIPTAVNFLRDIASHIPLVTGSVPSCGNPGTSAMIWKEPYGVIFGISPW